MKTTQEILGDFVVADTRGKSGLKGGKPITIWLPAEAKASYDLIQEKSGRRFSAKVREMFLELIADAKARIK